MMKIQAQVINAAALIIGDEILTGKIQDRNGFELAQQFFDCGVNLARMEIITDSIDDIVCSLQTLSKKYDVVISSGGIGPTHDDRTYEAVAKAFDLELRLHEPTVKRFYEFQQQKNTPIEFGIAQQKMAILPFPAEVITFDDLWMPIIHVNRTFVLPGIPRLFEKILRTLTPRWKGVKKKRILIGTQCSEGEIAIPLEEIQHEFSQVQIGSYPQSQPREFNVLVSVEGAEVHEVEAAAAQIQGAISGKLVAGFR